MDIDPAATPRHASAEQPVEPPSALRALLPHVLKTFGREPALALTAAYLLVALAGIFYNYAFFERGFGIPVLTLSQVGDFLVAGLQQPVALALMLSTFVVCWLFDWINQRSRRRSIAKEAALRALPHLRWWQARRLQFLAWHNRSLWLSQLTYAGVVVIYGSLFVGTYAGYRANAVRHGEVARVVIRLAGQPTDLPVRDPKGWGYLGAVANYVFVYDPKARRALILPVNAIERIQPVARPDSAFDKVPVPVPVVHLR